MLIPKSDHSKLNASNPYLKSLLKQQCWKNTSTILNPTTITLAAEKALPPSFKLAKHESFYFPVPFQQKLQTHKPSGRFWVA